MFCHLYCFAAATQGKFFLFKIQIFMLLKLESESPCKKSAIESESADFLAGLPSLIVTIAMPNKPDACREDAHKLKTH